MNLIKTAIISTLLLLTGCYQTVNIDDMKAAAKKCAEGKSTVFEITAWVDGIERVTCSNRKSYRI